MFTPKRDEASPRSLPDAWLAVENHDTAISRFDYASTIWSFDDQRAQKSREESKKTGCSAFPPSCMIVSVGVYMLKMLGTTSISSQSLKINDLYCWRRELQPCVSQNIRRENQLCQSQPIRWGDQILSPTFISDLFRDARKQNDPSALRQK